ncbi:hypothetical protein Cgig2_000361 [Carnegiea gigantea]|uniref:Uncharacterized protein n=1 Tax=Carnegiea gigantea TaxID=171969 RepID=A0A9Q1QCT4_9CARY|nr:hypothetical protein Cgig2_000361 [Carnegiea gigantea]
MGEKERKVEACTIDVKEGEVPVRRWSKPRLILVAACDVATIYAMYVIVDIPWTWIWGPGIIAEFTMELRQQSERCTIVDGNEKELVSKRCRTIVDDKGEGSCNGNRRTKRVAVLEEVDILDTSSRSNYMAASIESGGSSYRSESLEAELDFAEDLNDLEAGYDTMVLKGEKGKCVSMRGRCILKHIVPRSRAFRLADRLEPFSVFDVALLTGLPATWGKVDFSDESCTKKIVNMELRRMKFGKDSKDSQVYENFISTMVYLCEQNAREEQLDLWLKLFTWLVLSGLIFPHSAYGAA